MRPVAKKLRIASILSANYVRGDLDNTAYIEANNERVSRVHIVGRITDNGSVDDGSGSVRISASAEGPGIAPVAKGDLVRVIGKVMEDGKGRFVLAEIVKKLGDPNYESLWRLEAGEAPAAREPAAVKAQANSVVDDLGAL